MRVFSFSKPSQGRIFRFVRRRVSFVGSGLIFILSVSTNSPFPARREEGTVSPSGTESLVPVSAEEAPKLLDDSNLQDLKKAIEHSLEYYSGLPSSSSFLFGKDIYFAEDLAGSLAELSDFLKRDSSAAGLDRFIRSRFRIYRSRGAAVSGKVTFSAYHEHSMKAALKPTEEYRYPIYARPPDLVDVVMENFDPQRKGERIVGRAEGKALVPYYTREEIDSKKVLQGKGLEIAWAKDPLDILFLQIQGSGWIQAPESSETFHIRYAGDNGRPFRSVGSVLIETGAIPKEQFNRAALVQYMKSQTEEKRQSILNQNPRYIFFEIVSSTNSTRGSLLVSLTAGRSIASDPKFYPQGALAWISTEKPAFDAEGKFAGTKPLSRFVLNQDEGGAIKGCGRIDFFAGGGVQAERMAQKLWYPGELYFFVKKSFPRNLSPNAVIGERESDP
jgi:membrane-bound lytic murein transglycosylase A